VLFLASLDAVPLCLMEELIDAGRLPALSALMKQGTVLDAAPLPLVGVAYSSEYGGRRPADHGIYFPFQWSAEAQRVRSWHRIGLAETVFSRVDERGRRMVVIDPPECFPQSVRHGFMVSGWQFRERVLLAPWHTHRATSKELEQRFGRGARTEESFGHPDVDGLLAIHRVLAEAPERLRRAAEFFLEADPPEVLWINFAGLHLASHQFFDLSLLDGTACAAADRRRLELALASTFEEYDRVLGRILERLPVGSDTLAFCSKGIGPVIGWVDLLPEMLGRVLGAPTASGPVSAVRTWVPRAWREAVAGALPDPIAKELAARLWSPRADWSRTRAFALPSDAPGFIRLNLRGREKLGCVPPDDAAALCAEIVDGLSTFTDLDGDPCIRRILRPVDVVGTGARLDAFPDLLVFWAPKKTLRGRGVRSPRFGEVLRRGESGTGRSGDHAEGALAIVAPAGSRSRPPNRKVQPYDIPATILSALGLPHDDLPGHALLEAS
jgi:predicted AlkP superfamily phosphohydrolase/phosphomutase